MAISCRAVYDEAIAALGPDPWRDADLPRRIIAALETLLTETRTVVHLTAAGTWRPLAARAGRRPRHPARRHRGRPVLPHVSFHLDPARVRELVMGTELYGEPALAIRELYQKALDARRDRQRRRDDLIKTRGQGRDTEWAGEIAFEEGALPAEAPRRRRSHGADPDRVLASATTCRRYSHDRRWLPLHRAAPERRRHPQLPRTPRPGSGLARSAL